MKMYKVITGIGVGEGVQNYFRKERKNYTYRSISVECRENCREIYICFKAHASIDM